MTDDDSLLEYLRTPQAWNLGNLGYLLRDARIFCSHPRGENLHTTHGVIDDELFLPTLGWMVTEAVAIAESIPFDHSVFRAELRDEFPEGQDPLTSAWLEYLALHPLPRPSNLHIQSLLTEAVQRTLLYHRQAIAWLAQTAAPDATNELVQWATDADCDLPDAFTVGTWVDRITDGTAHVESVAEFVEEIPHVIPLAVKVVAARIRRGETGLEDLRARLASIVEAIE